MIMDYSFIEVNAQSLVNILSSIPLNSGSNLQTPPMQMFPACLEPNNKLKSVWDEIL